MDGNDVYPGKDELEMIFKPFCHFVMKSFRLEKIEWTIEAVFDTDTEEVLVPMQFIIVNE